MELLAKQKYSYSKGIDWSKCVITKDFYMERGVKYTLFGFIKWKWITEKNKLIRNFLQVN